MTIRGRFYKTGISSYDDILLGSKLTKLVDISLENFKTKKERGKIVTL